MVPTQSFFQSNIHIPEVHFSTDPILGYSFPHSSILYGPTSVFTWNVRHSEGDSWERILHNPRHKYLPDGIQHAARKITSARSKLPSIPINRRFAESVSALKVEGAMLNVLLYEKDGIPHQNVYINT